MWIAAIISASATVDRGIAMLHIELGAAAEGVHGTWRKRGEDMCFMPDVE